jgi:hypothetical protein
MPLTSRIRRRRHLGLLFGDTPALRGARAAKAVATTRKGVDIPPEFTAHGYAVFLLHIAAELEHVLMVEYLYAGYSLGGPSVPVEHRAQVAGWRETILGIAKEEMGHMMTVQNLLRCLGGALNLDREDYPWDSKFYPFPFHLGPLTRNSLARYVYAEAPTPDLWQGEEADAIRAEALKGTSGEMLHRIGALYAKIEELFVDPDALCDEDFRSATFPYQANWDEWGRGYKGGRRGNTTGGSMPGTPDVLVLPVTSRTDALAALRAVATQGEANPSSSEEAPSHFARFLEIYRHFPAHGSATREVAENPIVTTGEAEPASEGDLITNEESANWAHLFNVRYHSLLVCLLHTFDYPGNLSETSQMTPRGLLVHSTFGEMYNIRALSEILMQAPLGDPHSSRRAGPPFQMPYTLKLPIDPTDRWRLHLDLLGSTRLLVEKLLGVPQQPHEIYLRTLCEVDRQTEAMIRAILEGRPVSRPANQRHHLTRT